MAPAGTFLSTYNTYKAGTTKFTTWLVENARRCGADLSFLPTATEATKGSKKTTDAPKYPVPLSQFTNLARAIAASTTPKIRVPQHVVTLVRSVIDLRKQATQLFASFSRSKKDEATLAANAGHRHFISVLEEILDILKPAEESNTPNDTVESLFMALEVEDPTSDGTAPASKPKAVDTAQYDLETSGLDEFFAIFAFFKDMAEIRDHLKTVWQDYRNGNLDLMSAAITTDTAFNIMSRSSSDLVKSIPHRPTYAAILDVPLRYMESIGGFTPEFVDWVCLGTVNMLNSYCDVLSPDTVPALKPGHFGVYHPERDRSKMSREEREQEDLIILMEVLPEFTKVSRSHMPIPAEDELTAGMRKMMDGNRFESLPIYAVFATQVFLDIHHVLREASIRPFQELQGTGKRVIDILDDYFRFSRSRSIMNWPPQNDEVFKRVSAFAKEWTQEDIMAKAMTKTFRKLGVTSRPFFLLKHHPVLCGLMVFRLNVLLQDGGINLCTAWGSVIYPAHLYNAARNSAGLEAEWKDMDYVISVHSPQRIFVGSPPTEPSEYLKRFLLALGASASNFARNRRPGGPALIVESKKGPRGLKATTPVKDIFREKYVYDKPAALTTPNIVAMLSVAAKAERLSTPAADLQAFVREMVVQPQYTSLQLLRIVREGVAAEELHLLFDYFGLHQRGLKLLRTLQAHLHSDLVKYFSEGYIEEESQLPYIIGYLFEVVRGSDRIADTMRVQGGSRMLHNAAEVLQRFLEDGENSRRSIMGAKALTNAAVRAYPELLRMASRSGEKSA